MKCLFFILTSICTNLLIGQIQSDTLNRYNIKNKKEGAWVYYYDSEFKNCTSQEAKYYCFVSYLNGQSINEPYAIPNKKDYNVFYKFNDDSLNRNSIAQLNGELYFYYKTGKEENLEYYQKFEKGRLTVSKQYFSPNITNKSEMDLVYFDSLYQNKPNSILYYKIDAGIPIYKQYFYPKKKYTEKTMLVKGEAFNNINRFRLGLTACTGKLSDTTLKPAVFLEFGGTKKFIRGAKADTTGKNYFDNNAVFHSITISGMGGLNKGNICFGQKVTYSYVFLLLKGEAGIIYFTDFTKNDLRFMFGAGLTVFGYFNMMFQAYVPLTNSKIGNIPMVGISFDIN